MHDIDLNQGGSFFSIELADENCENKGTSAHIEAITAEI